MFVHEEEEPNQEEREMLPNEERVLSKSHSEKH
jgi:hypothetical protein